jgi:hypothetical protein
MSVVPECPKTIESLCPAGQIRCGQAGIHADLRVAYATLVGLSEMTLSP